MDNLLQSGEGVTVEVKAEAPPGNVLEAAVLAVETLEVKVEQPQAPSAGEPDAQPQDGAPAIPEVAADVEMDEPVGLPAGSPLRKRAASDANGNGNGAAFTIVPTTAPQLVYTPLKTGLAYDNRMRYHAKIFTLYYEYIDPHPEDPRRIYRIYKILAESGLINDPGLTGRREIGELMQKIPVREATDAEILAVHTQEHLDFIALTETMPKEGLLELTERGDSVYFNHDLYTGAKLLCGGTIEACAAVVLGSVKNALAVVRPPGHHAEPETPGGFCLFSNVAVAAKNILLQHPDTVRRIVILDWDVHHGNGTQKAFYDDPRVLYISLHRYEGGKYYPGTTYGGADMVGEGAGAGFNLNIPWSVPGMHDGDYVYAFERLVMPVCREFSPDLVIVLSGFDAAAGDVIGGCHVTPSGYGHMTHMLKSLANGHLCVVLEGGYNLDSISVSALAVAKVLVGEVPGELAERVPQPEAVQVVAQVTRIHALYWKCLQPGFQQIEDTLEPDLLVQFKLGEAIRQYQARSLADKYQMVQLPVLKKAVHFWDDQVMALATVQDADTVVVCVHDPPEVWGATDPVLGTLDAANLVVLDPSAKVVEWAVLRGYAVVDVYVPTYMEDDYAYLLHNASLELMLYLWDNYLSFFSASKVAFVGVGEAYLGVVHLLGHRDVRLVVKALVAVTDRQPLRAVVPLVDESVTDWYFRNLLVFTAHNHPVWEGQGELVKRPRRKFGRVLRADSLGPGEVFRERWEEMSDFVLDGFEE